MLDEGFPKAARNIFLRSLKIQECVLSSIFNFQLSTATKMVENICGATCISDAAFLLKFATIIRIETVIVATFIRIVRLPPKACRLEEIQLGLVQFLQMRSHFSANISHFYEQSDIIYVYQCISRQL